jgi:ABC-type antimicrobial peptide transport system permease subunit
VNPDLPLARAQTVEEIRTRSMAQTSFALVMIGVAASVALLIGVVGVYGVIAYAVSQRTREIGIRMALGAQIADVQNLFLHQGLWLTATGILIGIGMAMVVTRVMSAFLFGVGPMDLMTYATVSVTLAAVAGAGVYLPTRRAIRVDPLVALRAE